jgi:hypothetical protein
MQPDKKANDLGRGATAICVSILLAGCAARELRQEPFSTFKNSNGDVISISRNQAIVRGISFEGRDCGTKDMQCVDYSGYFAIVAPRHCQDGDKHPWRAGSLVTTPLGSDYHNSQTMYGVNLGEMVAYVYSWDGDGVVGLAFDGIHRVANSDALEKMGYRDSSIFYNKEPGSAFMACKP